MKNWPLVDGRCALAGFDPLALPPNRFINLLHAMVVDSVWDSKDREDLETKLDWPEMAEQRDLEAQDRNARRAMAALGIDPNKLLASAAAQRAAQEIEP